MTTSSRKNYNINTLRGMTNDDDEDVVDTLGLDPRVAYSPDIIVAQVNRDVTKENYGKVTRQLIKPHLTPQEMKYVDKHVVGKQQE